MPKRHPSSATKTPPITHTPPLHRRLDRLLFSTDISYTEIVVPLTNPEDTVVSRTWIPEMQFLHTPAACPSYPP